MQSSTPLPCRVTMATKSRMDCLERPSFHDGSGSSPCARAGSRGNGPASAGSIAKVESNNRRLIREEGVALMLLPVRASRRGLRHRARRLRAATSLPKTGREHGCSPMSVVVTDTNPESRSGGYLSVLSATRRLGSKTQSQGADWRGSAQAWGWPLYQRAKKKPRAMPVRGAVIRRP